jgi:hypothetical protein
MKNFSNHNSQEINSNDDYLFNTVDMSSNEFEEQMNTYPVKFPIPVAKPTRKAVFLESVATVINFVLPSPLSCMVICKGGKCKYESTEWPSDQVRIFALILALSKIKIKYSFRWQLMVFILIGFHLIYKYINNFKIKIIKILFKI